LPPPDRAVTEIISRFAIKKFPSESLVGSLLAKHLRFYGEN